MNNHVSLFIFLFKELSQGANVLNDDSDMDPKTSPCIDVVKKKCIKSMKTAGPGIYLIIKSLIQNIGTSV